MAFGDNLVSFHANSVIVPKLGHDRFHVHLFQLIAFGPSYCHVYAVSHFWGWVIIRQWGISLHRHYVVVRLHFKLNVPQYCKYTLANPTYMGPRYSRITENDGLLENAGTNFSIFSDIYRSASTPTL
jgi:hypothetical protein